MTPIKIVSKMNLCFFTQNFNFISKSASGIDDFTCNNALIELASAGRRHVVLGGVEKSLKAECRKAVIQHFTAPWFNIVAHVAVGNPTQGVHDLQRELDKTTRQQHKNFEVSTARIRVLMDRKKDKADRDKQRAVLRTKRKHAERLEHMKKLKEEREAKQREAEAKTGTDVEVQVAGDTTEESAMPSEVPAVETSGALVAVSADAKDEKPKEDLLEGIPEPDYESVEKLHPFENLEVDNSVVWRKRLKNCHDLSDAKMTQHFSSFTLPSIDEGFHSIDYQFIKDEKKAAQTFDSWKTDQKLNFSSQIDKVSAGFTDAHKAFVEASTAWKKLLKDKASMVKGKYNPTDESGGAATDADAPLWTDLVEAVDVMDVADIDDAYETAPLYLGWSSDDFAMCKSRFEFFNILAHFRKDSGDADHPGITLKSSTKK